jgi:hypothetical protein
MQNSNIKIFLKALGNFELTKYFDPEALRTLIIDDVNYQITHNIINNGEPASGSVPITPGDTTLKLHSYNIKRDSETVFQALRYPKTEGLGRVTVQNGNNTEEYSNVKVVMGFKTVGNPSEFNEITAKFFK